MSARKIVPQAFESQRRALRAAFPQQSDHFAVRAHRSPAAAGLVDQGADLRPEPIGLRPMVHQDLLHHLVRVEGDVLLALAGCRHVDAAGRQMLFQRGEMCTRGDDDAGAVRAQAAADEFGQRLDQRLWILVELDQMLAVADLRPMIDGWRGR